jgi:hypothetical protein
MDDDSLLIQCELAQAEYPAGQDWRGLAESIAIRAGIPVDWRGQGGGKGCILSGLWAIKTGQPWQISQAMECAERLGDDFALIFAAGKHWMIQERVKPIADAGPLVRAFRARGVTDTRRNCGTTASGRVVAFDGFPVDMRA